MPSVLDDAQHAAAIVAAAARWHVPAALLAGVYGRETGFGSNVATSSAGAVGSFQFLPSTARQYGYPVTNATDAKTFAAQADAAAHYLSDLAGSSRDWSSAVAHYSGGGYTLKQAVQTAVGNRSFLGLVDQAIAALPTGTSVPPLSGGPGGIAGGLDTGVTAGASAVSGAVSTVGDLLNLVTSGSFWLRVLEALGGIILLALGLVSLTGGSAQQVATVAARVAK